MKNAVWNDDELSKLKVGSTIDVYLERIESARSGEIVLSGYLTSTGSKVYKPISLKIDSPITANIVNGKINSFYGNKKVVEKVQKHYETVSKFFNIERNIDFLVIMNRTNESIFFFF